MNKSSPTAETARTPLSEPGFSWAAARTSLDLLLSHRRFILLFTLAVVVATALFLATRSSVYVSEATLLLRRGHELTSFDPTVLSSRPPSLYQSWDNVLNSELAILGSRDIAEHVLDELGLGVLSGARENREGSRTSFRHKLSAPFRHMKGRQGAVPEAKRVERTEAVDQLLRHLSYTLERDSSVIKLSFWSGKPKTSQQILTSFIEAFRLKHIAVHSTPGSYEFLQQQVETFGTRLAQAETDLGKLLDELGATSLSSYRTALDTRVMSLQQQLEDTRVDILAADSKVASLRDSVSGSRESEAAAAPLRARPLYTQNAYTDIQVVLVEEEANAKSLAFRADALREHLNENRKELQRANKLGLLIARKERQRNALEKKYEAYAERLEQARVMHALEAERLSNISIVQAATLPVKPEGISSFFKLLLAALLGLAAGSAIVVFRDRLPASGPEACA